MDSLYKSNNFKRLKRSGIILLFAGFLFFVVSCGGGSTPLPPRVARKAILAETKKVEPVNVAEKAGRKELEKREEEFAYNPTGKKDPFKPFIQLTRDKKRTGSLPPLQNYDLSQVKLVGIIPIP